MDEAVHLDLRPTREPKDIPPEFDGLRALWRTLKRIAAVLMMACVGGLVAGVTAGAATFYVYCIGAWLGFPLGVVVGGLLGSRTPARIATLVFTGCAYVIWISTAVGEARKWDGLLIAAVALGVGMAAAPIAYLAANKMPVRAVYWAAVVSACVFCLWMAISFTQWLTAN